MLASRWLDFLLGKHSTQVRAPEGKGVPLTETATGTQLITRQLEREAIEASLPQIAWSAFFLTGAYIGGQLLFRPEQVFTVWAAYATQLAVPLVLWASMHTTLRGYVEDVFLACDLMYAAALSAQLLGPQTHPSGIAGFVAVKLLATAVFVPWHPYRQWAAIAGTLILYFWFLPWSPRLALESHRLHLYALPAVAALLSALGVRRVDAQRRQLVQHAVDRELALDRLQLLLDHMPAACLVIDRSFRYVYWNRAAEAMFGYRTEEVRGKSAFEVITPPHLQEVSRRGLELIAELGAMGPIKCENITKDGHTLICEWSSAALRDVDGSLYGMLSMCQDVTERYRDEEERRTKLEKLQEIDRLRSDFVATMAHELRTPLNILLGYAEILTDETFGPLQADQKEIVDRMARTARELIDLVNSALDMSRLEAGQTPVRLQVVRIEELLQEIRDEMREVLRKDRVQVQWEADPNLPPLYTDATKLKVIVKNLLSNAMKYTNEGTVRVHVRRKYPGVDIIVADTGRGIPEEELPHIFRPFHQVRMKPLDEPAGAGLGLYLVQRFAELLGAEVRVESKLGEGSSFTVWLPTQPPGVLLG